MKERNQDINVMQEFYVTVTLVSKQKEGRVWRAGTSDHFLPAFIANPRKSYVAVRKIANWECLPLTCQSGRKEKAKKLKNLHKFSEDGSVCSADGSV